MNSAKNNTFLKKKLLAIKKNILQMSYEANVGHIGSAFSIAEILTVLYHGVLKIDKNKPLNPSRDRFILSKGHAASALYATLHSKGFFPKNKLLEYCKPNSIFGVHPEYNPRLGIEFSTGSLGHGLSVGIGLALSFKRFQKKIIPRIFVLISDAELNEGSVWEGIMFAGHHKLDNLVVILDDNNFQAFGRPTEVLNIHPIERKWESFGWTYKTVNGHNISQLYSVLQRVPFKKDSPSVLIAKTKTANGISFLEDRLEAHYQPLSKTMYKQALIDITK